MRYRDSSGHSSLYSREAFNKKLPSLPSEGVFIVKQESGATREKLKVCCNTSSEKRFSAPKGRNWG